MAAIPQQSTSRRVLPGFRLTLGFSLFYLSVVVLVPMGAMMLRSASMGWNEFWTAVLDARAVAAYRLSFGSAAIAASINVVFGTLLAWVLGRYHFPGRRLMDGMVDIPFALPTAVGGLALSGLYADTGWLGRWLSPIGIKGVYSPLGIVIALTFVSLPFVVRTVQPVLETLDRETEEAAASLGASRARTFFSVILPTLFPSILTGFALAFARSVGEFGSIIFVSSHLPFKTEIAPLVVINHLDEHRLGEAVAVAVFLMLISFVILAVINLLEAWARRFQAV